MKTESKKPMDISFVEKPPVAIIVIPCATLSKPFIPVTNNEKLQIIVRKK